jgi:hypothetical protein
MLNFINKSQGLSIMNLVPKKANYCGMWTKSPNTSLKVNSTITIVDDMANHPLNLSPNNDGQIRANNNQHTSQIII